MSCRVLVHAGFHKTGTSSVQRTLRRNNGRLSNHIRLFLKDDLTPLCEAARAYSIRRDALDLGLVTYEAAQLFETLDLADPRPVVISAEDLSGHMPGRHGLRSYAAAPTIMACLVDTAAAVSPDIQMEFWFTLRASEPWLKSCHAQNVRASRYRGDLASYTADIAPETDLAASAAAVADQTGVPVSTDHIEEIGTDPLGPAARLLTLAGLDRQTLDALIPVRHSNPSLPDAIIAEMLALNRSDQMDREVHQAKLRLAQAHETAKETTE